MNEQDRDLWSRYAAAAIEGITSRYPLPGNDAQQAAVEHIVGQCKAIADTMLKNTPAEVKTKVKAA